MPGRNLALFVCLALFSIPAMSTDLDHAVSGDSDVEDVLGASKNPGNSPYVVEGNTGESVENSKPKGEDFVFDHGVKEVSDKTTPKKKFEDFGYTTPGTFENQENYVELDKLKMANEFRKVSTGAITFTFLKDSFDYASQNDIINRTVSSGPKSVKGGALYVRHDSYISKSLLLNTHWSLGGGVGFNTGKGIFVDGTRSDATFNLWEIPLDAGLGIEIPVYSWFKISGTGGPSLMALLQSRSDFQNGEKGKRKYQYSPGYFANAQFKINLTGFNEEAAYDLFTTSQITNLYLNLEARYQNYSNFQDPIQISGASFGIGFTFEYL